ncbi:MAG: protein kinase [Acidobacteriota bacterium]|nr:protein kinase [Acidobacteriota bacterium]
MGEVYRARDTRLGREVAIKVLSAGRTNSAEARRRFEQEARAVAALSHPNILSIHHFETENGISFAVTELLQGQTLRDRIEAGRVRWTEAVHIAAAICDGLAAAHEKGIIHRDLKPSNVFLTSDGQVKILDFGLARISSTPADDITDLKTAPGTVMGTLGYMSPEQLRGEDVDATTDIFALGCVVYEMIAGKSPFVGAAALRDEPNKLTDAPPALIRIIDRCLAKNRHDRYHSARDLALDLRSLPQRRPKKFVLVAGAAAVLIAVLAIMLTRSRPAAPPQREIRSILVLPFENQSHDPGAEYLSDGIAEGLISKLAELPTVRVIARTTAFRFKGKPLDLPAIRKELDVDGVLSGRVLSRANKVIVQADLIDASTGTELWGSRFHEESADVLTIEQDIVGRISDALRVRLTPAQQSRMARPSTRNPEAYRLYLQGRFFWNKRTPDGVRKAKDLFEQAIAIDPQFALAYAGLADVYNIGGEYHYLPLQEARLRAGEAARTALRLDPELAEGHASLGLFESNRFHWDVAEREFKKALEINPNYASTLQWYSILLGARGRIDDSLTAIRKAEEIDPLSAVITANFIAQSNARGDYAAALAAARKAMELDPGYIWIYLQTGAAYEGLGQVENAVETYLRGADIPGPPGFHEFFLARVAALRGNRSSAGRYARELATRAESGEVSPAVVAWTYTAAGDHDKALEWFNRAVDVRDGQIRGVLRNPIVRELRGDPRYDVVLRRIERGFQD